MSKRNCVLLLDDVKDEEVYKESLSNLKEMVDLNEVRITIADTDFYLSKIYIIEKIFGPKVKVGIIDLFPDKDISSQIRDWMYKRGWCDYETLQ